MLEIKILAKRLNIETNHLKINIRKIDTHLSAAKYQVEFVNLMEEEAVEDAGYGDKLGLDMALDSDVLEKDISVVSGAMSIIRIQIYCYL